MDNKTAPMEKGGYLDRGRLVRASDIVEGERPAGRAERAADTCADLFFWHRVEHGAYEQVERTILTIQPLDAAGARGVLVRADVHEEAPQPLFGEGCPWGVDGQVEAAVLEECLAGVLDMSKVGLVPGACCAVAEETDDVVHDSSYGWGKYCTGAEDE